MDSRLPESEHPTLPAPPGRPCGHLFCGDLALYGSDRCERHPKHTIKMPAVQLEKLKEQCK